MAGVQAQVTQPSVAAHALYTNTFASQGQFSPSFFSRHDWEKSSYKLWTDRQKISGKNADSNVESMHTQ